MKSKEVWRRAEAPPLPVIPKQTQRPAPCETRRDSGDRRSVETDMQRCDNYKNCDRHDQ